ncbi:hypothetical protein OnM2_064064 [Erysiphe neolycopersici]|uniref:Uncharacterized protein n=1 Tax=Erysiphe neolycopersici TaxID=212602 RepID=A0A420HN80_9PEZI|nr:hypothetical protein OnM2_064064 [Erysiphe neolycopersici]
MDAVNSKEMLAYNFLNTVICTFLKVHSYSAFLNEDKDSIISFDQLHGGKLGGVFQSKVCTTKQGNNEMQSTLNISDKSYSVQRSNEVCDDDEILDESLEQIAQTSKGYIQFNGMETVSHAMPVKHKSIGIDPHECAVDDMTKILERLKSTDQLEGNSDRKVFSDPQLLVDELALLKLDEIEDDDIRELDRCVRNLNYIGNGYLTKNPQIITEMLTALNPQIEIRLAEPTYIPSVCSPFSSDIFKLLSRFGPEAPSFWNDRGSEIVCKAGEKTIEMSNGKRKIGETDIYMNMPSKIMITPKPLFIAVRDLEKVVDKVKVKMDANERAGRYRHVSIEHDETKRKLWKELVV